MGWQDTDVWFTAGHMLGRTGDYFEEVVKPHNERVEREDLVWHLGGLTVPGFGNLATQLLGKINLISGPGDETFVGTPDVNAERNAEQVKLRAPNIKQVNTGRGFAKHRIPVLVPLGFGFESVGLWCLPYTGTVDTARWRPPIPTKTERRWLLHGQPSPVGEAVDVRNRQISVHIGCWDGKPVHIDEIRSTIRNAS